MTIHNGIPFLDLITPHVELEPELMAVFQQALAYRRIHRWSDGGGVRKSIR